MLNERLEYEEYTVLQQDERLFGRNFEHGSGIVRPLTIIARKAYFDDAEKILKLLGKEDTIKNRTDVVKDILRLWLGLLEDPAEVSGKKEEYKGFSDPGRKERLAELMKVLEKVDLSYQKLEDGYNNYATEVLSAKYPAKAAKIAKLIKEQKATRYTEYEKVLLKRFNRFYPEAYGAFRSIRLDKIVADAIDEGPLRVGYLVLKKSAAEKLRSTWGEGVKPITARYQAAAMKVLAAYLIETEESGNTYAQLTMADLSNWMNNYSATVKSNIRKQIRIAETNEDGTETIQLYGTLMNLKTGSTTRAEIDKYGEDSKHGVTSLSPGVDLLKLHLNRKWLKEADAKILWDTTTKDAMYLELPKVLKTFLETDTEEEYLIYVDKGVKDIEPLKRGKKPRKK